MMKHEEPILFKGFDVNHFLGAFSLVRLPMMEDVDWQKN